jgi:hypothetical protein
MADRLRAKTASPRRVSGTPNERAVCTVQVRFLSVPPHQDPVNEWCAVGFVMPENIGGDFDQIAIEISLVPSGEDLCHLTGGHAIQLMHDVIGFADQLHIAIFDAVVYHFYKVPGALFSNPSAAGQAIRSFGCNGFE